MSIPYHLSCAQSHPILYELGDGRFQIMGKESLAPLMIGFDYVIVENDFAEFLRPLDISGLGLEDVVLYDPETKKENFEFSRVRVELRFELGSMEGIDLSRLIFLVYGDSNLFVSPPLRRLLEASKFKYLRFSYGFEDFAGHSAFSGLKTIDELRLWGADSQTIEKAEFELKFQADSKRVIGVIREAFCDVTLEGGVGLWEAQAIDDREDKETQAKARESDELQDWSRIPVDDLYVCCSSLSFFDAKGMRFHLPAFLIAELDGTYREGVVFHLVTIEEWGTEKFELLTPTQRAAVREYLKHVSVHQNYEFYRQNILRVLEGYWRG